MASSTGLPMKPLNSSTVSLWLLCLAPVALAAELPKATRTFIAAHCVDCHDASTARAGFRIDLLTADFTTGNNAGLWHEVMNKINSGEMPPKKKPRPDAKEAFAVSSWVARKLDETTKASIAINRSFWRVIGNLWNY